MLKKDIETEQKMKIEKRQKEKEDAWKIIKQNDGIREKRMAEREHERLAQVRLIEEYNKTLD